MKMKLFAILSMAFMLSLGCGCSKENGPDGDGNQTDNGNYIAEKSVKRLTLHSSTSNPYFTPQYVIYEDFDFRYSLKLERGNIILSVYERFQGEFSRQRINYYWNNEDSVYQVIGGLKVLEDINTLKQIDDTFKTKDEADYTYENNDSYGVFHPGQGYVIWMEKSPNPFVRARAVSYTLDYLDALESVTLEYQLF